MRVSLPSKLAGTVALTVGLACAACGSSTPPASVGQQFLAITTSINTQLGKDVTKNSVTANANYSKTFKEAAAKFKTLTYPAAATRDAHNLETTLTTMSTLAEEVSKAAAKNQSVLKNVTTMADINLKLIEAEKTEHTDANKVRHDIGLPPEATTTTTTPTTTPAVLTPSTTTAG